MRVVSLIASGTEIVSALGVRDELVGRSHECDFPPTVESLPVCSAPRLDVNRSSREIDEQVKSALEHASAVYELDIEQLVQLNPDVIVTQAQCDVCAVSLSDVEQAAGEAFGQDVQIVSLKPDALIDIWNDIRAVARALDRVEQGERLVEQMQRQLERLREQTQSAATKPRVACIEWIDPLMAAGNWMPELVEIAGGENLFGTAGVHSPWMEWDDLRAADPDVIVVLPCGFDINRSLAELPPLTERPGWQQLQAVRGGRVFVTDGNQYFNRPGPRIVESAEILAEILHPTQFDFGHQGTGWINLVSRGP